MDDKEREELQNQESRDWERAQARPGRKKPRAVVSVAFNRDDFETVAAFAERAGMKLSEFIRSAAIGCAEGKMPVVFLPQLIGLAFGVPEAQLLFKRHVVPVEPMLAKLPA